MTVDSAFVRWPATVLFAIGMLVVWTRGVTQAPVYKDAAQLVQMAVNLEQHGVISMDEHAPYTPSDYREPLPVATLALAAKIVDSVDGAAEPGAYVSGERVQKLKYQNLVWLALLSGGAFCAVRVLGGSFFVSLFGAGLANLRFLGTHGVGGDIDTILTEIPAAAVLMWSSVALSLAFTRRKLAWFALAGVLLGLVALIKAAVLYVFAGIVGVWLAVNLWQRAAGWLVMVGRELAVLMIGFCLVVGPWMYRNLVDLGGFEISQRAGMVLMYRGLYDLMTPEEYLGSFYLWSPRVLQSTLGKVLHFTPADSQRNGRLARLNDELSSDFAADDQAAELAGQPDRAISYYWKARAQREQAATALAATGLSETDSESGADKILKARALTIFREHPARHLAATVPFMWRGAPRTFAILVLAMLLSLGVRRLELAAFALPAFGVLLEYALFTHFVPRYEEPTSAIASVAALGVLIILWDRYRSTRFARQSAKR